MPFCDRRIMLYVYAFAAFFGVVQPRAVNISNTWMLPEEGFPVFYRYFRDRISWYEADAVCQFHHANLVTADNTSQYDAIRAYLKELDITEKVWIGLSKSPEKANFMWTDFHSLSNEGHWQESLPNGDSQSLCAVMDPAADFLWRPLPCGGPEVAAFICELPIPSWASGPRGCLLTELPSLTVLYIPEQSALELTSDCGLDGTKRIACKGNADHEEMLQQLTCLIPTEDVEEDKPTKTSTSNYYETATWDDNSMADSKTTRSWTSNTVIAEYGSSTRHRRETEDSLSPITTKSSFKATSHVDLLWQNAHKEKSVLTTEHVNLLENSTPVSSTIEEVTKKEQAQETKPQPIMTVKPPTSSEDPSTVTVSSNPTEVITKEALSQVTNGKSATQENSDDYPSAINQGQLFTIIENGTMFDLIELNETEEHQQATQTGTTSSVPTATVSTDKRPITKKPILPTKKTELSITSKPTKHVPSVDEMEENLTKEFEMMPDIHDKSIKLNRTFRKELPPLLSEEEEEQGNLEKGSQFGVPRIVAFTVLNAVDDEKGYQNDQPQIDNGTHTHNKTPLMAAKSEEGTTANHLINDANIDISKRTVSVTDSPVNPVDPRIYMINHHLSHPNHTEEHNVTITTTNAPQTTKYLPKSLLGEDAPSTTVQSESDGYSDHPFPSDEPKKVNRHRNLHTNKGRKFYPYFFSRMLG